MRYSFLIVPFLSLATAMTQDRAEVRWQTSLFDAAELAERDGKGLFVLQMFGRLDEELC